jgi:hypothetical protein
LEITIFEEHCYCCMLLHKCWIPLPTADYIKRTVSGDDVTAALVDYDEYVSFLHMHIGPTDATINKMSAN